MNNYLDTLLLKEIHSFHCPIHGDVECEVFPNFGDGKPFCPICAEEEAKRLEEKQRAENKRNLVRSRILGSGITELYLPKTYQQFETSDNPNKQVALDAVRAYAKNFSIHLSNGENLLLVGGLGSGKTHLGSCLCKELINAGHIVRYDTLKNLVKEVRKTWRGQNGDEDYVYERLTDLDLLIIDEVGRGKATEDAMDIACEIVDRRYNAIKPTVILGNVNIEKMSDYLDPRGVDRLLEKGAVIVMDWESYRTKGALS